MNYVKTKLEFFLSKQHITYLKYKQSRIRRRKQFIFRSTINKHEYQENTKPYCNNFVKLSTFQTECRTLQPYDKIKVKIPNILNSSVILFCLNTIKFNICGEYLLINV